ncbi:MAG: LPS export ABC transporter periplasmic protein LptC [Candidatus Methylomirabilis oxyfera]|nr:LPS export ABC transporter periplasmic protein LptC [Candidatus Methylomirabilis oxyfera]
MKRYNLVGYSLFVSAVSIVLLDVAIGAPPAPSVRQRDSSPDARISGFHLVETKGGIKLWEIWGDLAEVYEKEGIARVTKVSNQVTVTLYSHEGKLTSRSDKATLNMRTKDVHLEGNVSAASEQGSSLQTQSLDWSAEDRRLFTRMAVTLVKGGLVSRGVGMEAETDLERARLLSRVQSRVISQGAGVVTQDVPFVRKGGTR